MRTYHNDQAIKDKYIARFAEHRRLDQVIQGIGFENGKGCFIGCTLDNYDPRQFPVELGWPEWLAYLADAIFEGLSHENAIQFGTDLLEAVPIGVDLEPVRWKLAIWRHTQQINKLESNSRDYAKKCVSAIKAVIAVCKEKLESSIEEEANKEARSAEMAAWLAARLAESAVWSAESSTRSAVRSALEARSAALSSAWSAKPAAVSAVRSAAVSSARSVRSAERTAWSAAVSVARSAIWSARVFHEVERKIYICRERDMLLNLIKETR